MEEVQLFEDYTEVVRSLYADSMTVRSYRYAEENGRYYIYYLGTYMDKYENVSIRGYVSINSALTSSYGFKVVAGKVFVFNEELLLDMLYKWGSVSRTEHDTYLKLVKFQAQLL